MFAKTQNTVSMILGVALVAATTFAAPAFAGEASLAHNERAAQEAVLGTAANLTAPVDASSATLAHNEDLAQRAIVDATLPVASVATGEATLTQNEIAAQNAIAATSSGTARYAGSAKTRVASTRSPIER